MLEVRLIHRAPAPLQPPGQAVAASTPTSSSPLNERFPRLSVVRAREGRRRAATSGPLPSAAAARRVAEAIETAVPLRRCTGRPGAARPARCVRRPSSAWHLPVRRARSSEPTTARSSSAPARGSPSIPSCCSTRCAGACGARRRGALRGGRRRPRPRGGTRRRALAASGTSTSPSRRHRRGGATGGISCRGARRGAARLLACRRRSDPAAWTPRQPTRGTRRRPASARGSRRRDGLHRPVARRRGRGASGSFTANGASRPRSPHRCPCRPASETATTASTAAR